MCNLYGVYKKDQLRGSKKEKIQLIPTPEDLKMRGRDSFGIVTVDCMMQTVKSVSHDIKFPDTKNLVYLAFESRAIPEPELIEHAKNGLDHTRDTQPFLNDVWITSHNGTVIQPEKIVEKYKLKPTSPVDSAILPELFKKMEPDIALKDVLDGSYALAAYDRKYHRLYLCSNFQPLYYVETEDYIYYASLKEQLEYLQRPVEKIPPYTAIFFRKSQKVEISLYRRELNNRVLVICSGGLDSVTTARLYQVLGYEVSLIHFLYAQAAEGVEFEMIKKIADTYKWPLMVLDLRSTFAEAAKSSRLLQKDKGVNAVDDAEGTPSYVGNRNMIFASIAAGIAEEHKIGRVVMGLNLSDGSAYPDNCIPYLLNIEEALKTSLNQQSQVLFRSPFTNLMKHEILRIAIKIGSPLTMQASCYYPTFDEVTRLPVYCDGCGSHLLRAYAFKHVGYLDPIKYKQKLTWEGCVPLPKDFWDRMEDVNLRIDLNDIPFSNIIKKTL